MGKTRWTLPLLRMAQASAKGAWNAAVLRELQKHQGRTDAYNLRTLGSLLIGRSRGSWCGFRDLAYIAEDAATVGLPATFTRLAKRAKRNSARLQKIGREIDPHHP